MNALPLFSLFAFIVMLVLLPILFGELPATSLAKLHLSPEMALLLMMAIIIGGLINIPVRRIAHERVVPMHPLAVFGLGGLWPEMARERPETIIAINFGGCVVPAGLACVNSFTWQLRVARPSSLCLSPRPSTSRRAIFLPSQCRGLESCCSGCCLRP